MDLACFTTLEGMDSREIARLTGKQHAHVCRDIEEQLGKLKGGVSRFGHTYVNEQNGQRYRCFVLPKRECLILATGYDVVLREMIVDRWAELETKLAAPPRELTRVEILQMALDAAMESEELKAVVKEQAPIVAAYNRLSDAKGLFNFGDTAKACKARPHKFNQWMRDQGYLKKSTRSLVPMQEFINLGYFEVIEKEKGQRAYQQSMFTAKGSTWISKEFELWIAANPGENVSVKPPKEPKRKKGNHARDLDAQGDHRGMDSAENGRDQGGEAATRPQLLLDLP